MHNISYQANGIS